jgi:hypothetical protein
MYNRVLKRPMFRKGGSAAQGSGIMSYVEPRQEPRVQAANGFPNFGVSQAPINPVTGMTAYEEMLSNRQISTPTPRGSIEDQFTIGMDEYVPNIEYEKIPKEQMSKFRQNLPEFMQQRRKTTALDKKGIETLKNVPLYDEEETEGGAIDVSNIMTDRDKDKKKSPPTDTLSKPSEPKSKEQEIKDEAAFIKGLLKDENVSRGETALILAEALATPGGFNKKLQKARDLALPLIRERNKEDKAVTLAAYKAYKEKEQQQIKAGAIPNSLKEVRAQAEAIKAGGDTRPIEEIYSEQLRASRTIPYETKARVEVLARDKTAIVDTANTLANYKTQLSKLDPIKDKKKYDQTKNLYDKEFSRFNRDYLSNPEFKILYKGIYDEFVGKKDGGRVMKAVGGDVDTETESDIVTSEIETGGVETPVKTVQKLDYATLRDRLPKEINDQVVQVLASSEEALQDFSYITNQSDVDKFNVKYGVNLIIPPAQPMA